VIKKVSAAAAIEANSRVHGKLNEVERENSAVEASHRAEMYGEQAAVRFVRQRSRTSRERRFRKAERENIKANIDRRYIQMVKSNPELKKNAYKRHLHKKRMQKQFKNKSKETAVKAGKKTGETIGDSVKAVFGFIKNHPVLTLILAVCFLTVIVVQSCAGMALTMLGGLGGALSGGTSYLAADGELDETLRRYGEWENGLLSAAENAEISHPGYDEYIYSLDTPGHAPDSLLAYLTVKYGAFTFEAAEPELRDIFDGQYALTFTPSAEIRYRREQVGWEQVITGYDPVTGAPVVSWVPVYGWVDYDWQILTVTLNARSFEDVIIPRLATRDEQERYAVIMLTKGNR